MIPLYRNYEFTWAKMWDLLCFFYCSVFCVVVSLLCRCSIPSLYCCRSVEFLACSRFSPSIPQPHSVFLCSLQHFMLDPTIWEPGTGYRILCEKTRDLVWVAPQFITLMLWFLFDPQFKYGHLIRRAFENARAGTKKTHFSSVFKYPKV